MTGRRDPPRWASRIVALVAPAEDRAEMLGDLQERFGDRCDARGRGPAKFWYWRQALVLATGLSVHGVRRWLASCATPASLISFGALRGAGRAVVRSPLVSIVSIVTLGVGIGAPSTMFALVAGLMRPLPVEEPQQVVAITLLDPSTGRSPAIDTDVFLSWREHATGEESSLSSLGAYRPDHVAVSSDELSPRRYSGAYISSQVLTMLGVRPVAGSLFSPDDGQGGKTPLMLIREDDWRESFAGRSDAIGRTVRVDGVLHTIAGVLPAEFGFPSDARVWMTLDAIDTTRSVQVQVVGRLRDGYHAVQAAQELSSLMAARTMTVGEDAIVPIAQVQDYVEAFWGTDADPLRSMVRVAFFLMVIAAVNVGSVMLARGASRTGETAVRMAIGGSRAHVVAQLVYEAGLLSIAGAALGLALAAGALAVIRARFMAIANIAYWMQTGLGWSSLWFAAALAGGAVVIAGLLPAIRSSRVDLAGTLNTQGRGNASLAESRILPAIVGIEVTLSCALLLVSGFIVQEAIAGARGDLGPSAPDVLTGMLVLEDFDYPDESARSIFLQSLNEHLETASGIRAFATTTSLPGKDGARETIRIDGVSIDTLESIPRVQTRSVSPEFFSIMETSAREGRLLRSSDRRGTAFVGVINEAFAAGLLSPGRTVGSRIWHQSRDGTEREVTIVGVISDRQVTPDVDGRPAPALYLSIAQTLPRALLVMASAGPGQVPFPALREAVATIDPHLPWGNVRTMEAVMRQENADEHLLLGIFGAFGTVALLLAAVGLHGVVSFTVSMRVREQCIRQALGATTGRVLRHTLMRGLRPVFIGVGVGSALGLFLVPLFHTMLWGTGPQSIVIYLAVPSLLVAVSCLAVLGPALHAAGQDPMRVLRD